MALSKLERRQRIKHRIRKIVSGNATKPRLSVFRSNKEINAQLIDDIAGTTLVTASSREKSIASKKGTKVEIAAIVGKALADGTDVMAYNHAFKIVYFCIILGFLAIFLVKETNCKNIYKG